MFWNKLRRVFLVLIIIILLLSSCVKEQEVEVLSSDRVSTGLAAQFYLTEQYLYFSELIDKDNYKFRRLVRMNMETGQVSVPCVDPLCSHDNDDCPLCGGFMIDTIKMFGDWIYYTSDSSTNRKFIIYNLKTGEYRDVFKWANDGSMSASYIANIGDDLFHVTYSSENKDPVTGEYLFSSVIMSHNLSTGTEKKIYSSDTGLINLKFASSSRLYFGDFSAESLEQTYSIKPDGSDLREEPNFKCSSPGFIYSDMAYYIDDLNIWTNNLRTGDVQLVVDKDNIWDIYVTEQYIYYCEKEQIREMYKINRNDYEPTAEGAKEFVAAQIEYMLKPAYIWRCNLDGSNEELLIELPGAAPRLFSVYGDYLYAYYNFYDIETKEPVGSLSEQMSYCRINLSTGELALLPRSDD